MKNQIKFVFSYKTLRIWALFPLSEEEEIKQGPTTHETWKWKLKTPTNIVVDKITKKSLALWHQQAAVRVNAGCVEEVQNVLEHNIQKMFSFHSAGHPSTQMPFPLKGRRVLLHKLRYISSSTETAVSPFTRFLPPQYGLSNSCTNWVCIQNSSNANSYLVVTAWNNTSFLHLLSANRWRTRRNG